MTMLAAVFSPWFDNTMIAPISTTVALTITATALSALALFPAILSRLPARKSKMTK
jgi:hypothetical protein